jgi:hypothetical protein
MIPKSGYRFSDQIMPLAICMTRLVVSPPGIGKS